MCYKNKPLNISTMAMSLEPHRPISKICTYYRDTTQKSAEEI